MPRFALVAGLVTVLASLAGAAVWMIAGKLAPRALRPNHAPDPLTMRVVASGPRWVRLAPLPEYTIDSCREPGVLSLVWSEGWGLLGPVTGGTDAEVTRELVLRGGDLPSPGTEARIDAWVYPEDPAVGLGLRWEEVAIRTELGDNPSWLVPGDSTTWAIFVHGKGARRREALRSLPNFADHGLPCLVISYRNDKIAARCPDPLFRYGATEWVDVEAAVDYAREHGAEQVILVGYSMGGAVALSFLSRSPRASSVAAIVLDAPCLDLGAVITASPDLRRLPRLVGWLAMQAAALRYGIDWGALNYLGHAAGSDLPLLLFHGDNDQLVYVDTSDRLHARRSEALTYRRVVGAGHVRSWNIDPIEYDREVRAFVASCLGTPMRWGERDTGSAVAYAASQLPAAAAHVDPRQAFQ